MQITQSKKTETAADYTVVIPANDVAAQVRSTLLKYGETANIPGFRKGKVPESVLESKFGDSAFGDMIHKQIQESVEKITTENSLRLASQPNVDVKSAEKGKDIEFSLSFILLPEIKFMDFAKLKLETIKCKVSDKEVQESIDTIAKDFKDSKVVERAAKTGDIAVIDFLGKVDGVAFEGGAGSDYALELGSNSFIPGFEEQLVGVKAGDKKDVEVSFPEEYHAKELAGKPAVFECTIKEVKETVATEINDEFAKKLGVESIEVLQERVKERIAGQFDNETRHIVKKDLMDQLDENHKFEVPAEMIEQEFSELWKQVLKAKEDGQLEEEDANRSEAELEKEYRELSARRVRLGLLLTEVAGNLDIQVTQDDIQRAVLNEAQRYPGQEMQIFEFYKKNPKVLEQLRAPLLEEKVVDALLLKADVTEKELTSEEITALLAGDEEKVAEKPAAKKETAKKTVAKKTVAKKTPAKKTAAKKTPAKKS